MIFVSKITPRNLDSSANGKGEPNKYNMGSFYQRNSFVSTVMNRTYARSFANRKKT